MTAEMIISLISLAKTLIEKYKGRAKFADGSLLEQSHVDAAWAGSDAPFERIEDRAAAELRKLDGGGD
jgi:hypothetical protein